MNKKLRQPDFLKQLNSAQLKAVQCLDRPLLVIAGAGSGKTRTIIYRLAWLAESGFDTDSILLLTFTRKAAQEMLKRASVLFGREDGDFFGVNGGTFHSFAYNVLRRFSDEAAAGNFSILDRGDCEGLVKEIKNNLQLGKGDRSYPKASTIMEIIGKARNKELSISGALEKESYHLLPYLDDFEQIADAYRRIKKDHHLRDYDDLLFDLEELFTARPDILALLHSRYQHIMVDEYQDTNRVQARLTRLLFPASGRASIMAVGDDAQSIYAFRGADVRNILDFPTYFPGTEMVKLEENYRSLQPVLTLTNKILAGSARQFHKELVSVRSGKSPERAPQPELFRPLSDLSQARLVVARILELLDKYPPEEIAVLFRAGYQSYHLEVELGKAGLSFRKFGGLKFYESAHAKDVLAFLRLLANPADTAAFTRICALLPGIGPKTAAKLFQAVRTDDQKYLQSFYRKKPQFEEISRLLAELRLESPAPGVMLSKIIDIYEPYLQTLYPDDYPRRLAGLQELQLIAEGYSDPALLLADLSLELPAGEDEERDGTITLSTIHSAKGLEWAAVLIIDLVEERFPSRHSLNNEEDLEEERRLLYVACTRAKDYLIMFAPNGLYRRHLQAVEPVGPSPFLPEDGYEEFLEIPGGRVVARSRLRGEMRRESAPLEERRPPSFDKRPTPKTDPDALGYCRHKVFGRGKIVQKLPPDRYRVNFPGYGFKIIMANYVELE